MSEDSSKRTELDQVAQDLHQELDKVKEPQPSKSEQPSQATSKTRLVKTKKPKLKHRKKKRPVKFGFVKFKFVQEVDDSYVMEYGLSPDEVMKYRKNHFHIEQDPQIDVRENKASELKEEFGTYCGVKKSIKNWLYWV